MTYGVTPDGFNVKRLRDVLDESQADLALIQDPKTGNKLNPDFASDDPAMQIVQVPLNQTAEGWEAAQLAYDQFDPLKAVGPALDGIAGITGIRRLPSTPTIINITLTGTAGATIAAGQTISDEFDGNLFTTTNDVVLDGTGTGTTTASAVNNGVLIVANNTITKIKTPQPGWSSVTNDSTVVIGSNEETDAELEARRQLSNAAPSAAPADSVFANLANLPGVEYTRVYINNTLSTDARGIPAKTQAVIIQGGDDTEIAKTILQRSGATAEFFGSTTVNLIDAQGEPNPVSFSRPLLVAMTVIVDITITNASIYPSNGDDTIKNNIVLYAAGGADAVGAIDGFNPDGFPPGENVTVSRLYTPVNQVPGHRINFITVNGSPVEVVIAFNELASFDVSNITVSVT